MDSIPWKHILGDKLVGAERVELHPIVEAALVFIETNGLNTQGLFRVPGSASQVKVLKESFKTKKKVPDLSETEPNTVCSLLTDHLRSEEPLLTHALAPRWLQAAGLPDLVVRLTKYVDLINQLPVLNHATLFAMLRLLVLISQHAEKTLMPATNLGTIFGPMICRRLNSDIAQELSDIPAVSKLCIDLITHFSQLFDYYDLDPSASSAAAGTGGLNDSLSADSPRTKKTTRRKFQFGKDKPFHGERSGERSGGTASPAPGSSAGGSGSPSSTSALAAAALASGNSNSPVVPLQSPLVPAPEYDPSATGGDEGGRDQPGRARKNAVYGREDRLNDQLKSELSEGGQPRSPKSARGLLGSISLDADEDDSRPEGGTKMDGKSVMRSLSSMGGFYAKGVSKPLAVGDLETVHSSAAAQPDAEEFPEEEGKDADGKKDKKRLPALNLKKRKNSVDKKKLRMFSPRKLFDKDRSKASPDSSCESSDLERKYYDGSSSSEREEPTRRFGGRKIPFRSPRRKSSSWPEAELAEMRHRTDQAANHDDDSDLNDDSDSDDYDGSGADSSGAETPTSTSSSSSLLGGSEPKSRAKSDIPPGEAHSLEIAAVVRTERRKGSQSERGPSASARAAARAGKSLAGASSATSISPRGKRPDLADGDERLLSSSTSNTPKIWMASAPRPPNATTTNILLLKSPRVVGAAVSAAALDEALRGQEAIAGHLAPEEELGLVKWRRRMTAGSARRRPAGNVHAVAVEGGGDDDSENGETEENDGLRQQQRQQVEAPTTGVAFLLSKYYLYNNDNTGSGGAEGSSNGVDTKAAENDNKQTPQEREREKESRERDGGGAESEGDTENDDEVDDDGGTTTEDEGSSGGSGNGSSHGGSSGDEKGRRKRNSGAAEGKPRRRRSSNARKNGVGSGGSNKKATTAVKDSSGLKLGRKVRRGEEQVSEDEEDDHHLAPPAKASPIAKRIHSPRPRASEDHIGGAGGNSITID